MTSTGLDATLAKQSARRAFDAWSGTYDRSLLNYFLFRPSYVALMDEIVHWHAAHRRPFRLLDIGCATGTLARLLVHSGLPCEVVGLDYAASMCREAARLAEAALPGSGARFVNGDSENLPFADGSFDLVTCSNSFHHYPHQQRAVEEMRRVLRPGGRLVIADGFRDNVIGWVTFDVIITRVERQVYHAPWPVMHRYFTQAGFADIRRKKINFWFPILLTTGQVAEAA